MNHALFTCTDDGRYEPSELCLGPWGDSLHGGPVAGLLAHALESAEPDEDFHFTRLTVDLFRAVPRVPLQVKVETLRRGRRIEVRDARLLAGDEQPYARAVAVRLRKAAGEPAALVPPTLPAPASLTVHWSRPPAADAGVQRRRGYHTEVDGRRIGGHWGEGHGAAWFRLPFALVAGKPLTAFVQAASVSDFANGLAQRRFEQDGKSFGYINTDLTLSLLRYPESEWLAIDSRCFAGAHGSGMVRAEMYDEHGDVGVITQAVLANPREFLQR